MNFLSNLKIRTKIVSSIVLLLTIAELGRFLLNLSDTSELLLAFGVALLFGYLLSHFISKDLKTLYAAAQQLSNGNLNVELNVRSKDEFGLVSQSFNKMAARIKARISSSDALIEVMQRSSKETQMEKTLMIILEGAKKMTNSQYAALAVFDSEKKVEKFYQIGISSEIVKRMAHYPEGKGLLGYIHETKEHLRVEDMKKHPRSVGFPAGHPPMKSLLAFPLLHGNISLGNLYVSDKNSADKNFNEDDEHAMQAFAQIAANVIREKQSNAQIIESKQYLESEVSNLLKVIDRLAAGDLMVEIEKSSADDEISRLKEQLGKMVVNLRHLILQVKDAVEATASASAQISSSAEQMSSGAQAQTMQATEIAGAVEEMTKTILETSKNTSVASVNAKEAGDKAKDGGKVIVDTIEGMNRIAEVVLKSAGTVATLGNSSNQIGEIVQVIEDIADQTNLLALNAAIEAARAGEQGRGFAVVADEVRKLAERTTKATKEIGAMIKQIQKDTEDAVSSMNKGTEEVESGKSLANKAGLSLNEIIGATDKVSDIIMQVASAAEEQSKASDEISQNIEAITSVTHETSSGIMQIAQATEDLSKLTSRLQDLILEFKVDQTAVRGLSTNLKNKYLGR